MKIDKLLSVEQACKDNDHDTIRLLLDAADSAGLKKEIFLKIIKYYEEKSLLPVGYALLFIRWLIQNHDYTTAMEYILKCKKIDVAGERLSQIIYENLIKPNERFYRETFNKNLELLRNNEILISDEEFDFEKIKHGVTVIANLEKEGGIPAGKEDAGLFICDIMSMDVVRSLLENDKSLYIAYDDIGKFHYMLLFEHLWEIIDYIKRGKVIIFAGKNLENIRNFFDNLLVLYPKYVLLGPKHRDYRRLMDEIEKQRELKLLAYMEDLKGYYKDKDFEYYKNLFRQPASNITVLLINSIHTTINQHVTRVWYKAFLELGYTAKFVIETKPYETMNNLSPVEQIHKFKPDMVFWINFGVDFFFTDELIKNKLLWILRYRDSDGRSYADKGYDRANMFILPVRYDWMEQFKQIGVPQERMLQISEGIDMNIFTKNSDRVKQHACDIVCVNHAGGSEAFRISNMVSKLGNNKIFQEWVRELKEMSSDDSVVSFLDVNIKDFISEKLYDMGISLPGDVIDSILIDFIQIVDAFCRTKIMEWIVDSKITTNINLWGQYWSQNEKLSRFHKGTVNHGEELASIYRNSKVSISDSPWSLHERNFEIMGSGGFPLIVNAKMPGEEDEKANKIANYFKENEEVVLFYNKNDLLNKIQYYLDHPEDRERIAENGRQVVINNFSHVAIAKKTMDFIKSYYLTEPEK